MAAEVRRVVVAQRALARLGGGDRDAGGVGQDPERLLGRAVVDTAARHDQWPSGGADRAHRLRQLHEPPDPGHDEERYH